jgi:hypothetical protein
MAPLDTAPLEDGKEMAGTGTSLVQALDRLRQDEAEAPWEMMFLLPAPDTPDPVEAPVECHPAPEPRAAPEVRPPVRDEATPATPKKAMARALVVFTCMAGMVGPLGWGLLSGPAVCHPPEQAMGTLAAEALADRIVQAESNGRAAAKNARSSATGAGQFLNDTWLELIGAHRPDLDKAPQEKILELRLDSDLSHAMVVRLAERNAKILAARCLPVTPGTLYLAHFAGGGGAASVLSAPDHADAATAMAEGDSRGKLTREKIVAANPFLKSFTVAKLKSWADKKMESAALLVARKS